MPKKDITRPKRFAWKEDDITFLPLEEAVKPNPETLPPPKEKKDE
jgi:hypothetical protein